MFFSGNVNDKPHKRLHKVTTRFVDKSALTRRSVEDELTAVPNNPVVTEISELSDASDAQLKQLDQGFLTYIGISIIAIFTIQ